MTWIKYTSICQKLLHTVIAVGNLSRVNTTVVWRLRNIEVCSTVFAPSFNWFVSQGACIEGSEGVNPLDSITSSDQNFIGFKL